MGKKSKKEKEPTKIKVKVTKEHIDIANNKLKELFNKEINSNKNTNTIPNKRETTVEEMTEEFCKIIKFYRNLKKSDEQLCKDEKINPVDIALNNLCEDGIKRTLNYGYQQGARGDNYYKMMMYGIYGFVPDDDSSDPLKEFLKKASEAESMDKYDTNIQKNTEKSDEKLNNLVDSNNSNLVINNSGDGLLE